MTLILTTAGALVGLLAVLVGLLWAGARWADRQHDHGQDAPVPTEVWLPPDDGLLDVDRHAVHAEWEADRAYAAADIAALDRIERVVGKMLDAKFRRWLAELEMDRTAQAWALLGTDEYRLVSA